MEELCVQFKIKHDNSVTYRPKMNGEVEATNKNIKRIITKATETYRDWHEKLPFALYGYRTTVRTSTGATPFSLVYGTEAVVPIEVEIPSLRVLKKVELDEAEWIQSRLDQLNLIEEKSLQAAILGVRQWGSGTGAGEMDSFIHGVARESRGYLICSYVWQLLVSSAGRQYKIGVWL
ncbi:uncharacterized protein LOC120125532 [Hibiscus syriacus]|uniref:uncharacterized protein LOC120125532 n=1 Tax=Hibiscus syriacus TaxID=106335 RepID=UPI001920A543|nr:uncharacterized protein LOC120125532 [Hibiscus syriacus]